MEKAKVTAEEFQQLKQSPRSRWASCIDRLLRAVDGYVTEETIPAEDDTPAGRRRLDQSIRSYAAYRGLKVSVHSRNGKFLVQRVAKVGVEQ